jgi:tetratricopeptide (TPR) repeat protein
MSGNSTKLTAIRDQADAERDRLTALLSEELNKKRLALFLGAGCSAAAGLPTWKDLIFSLLRKYEIKTADPDLLRLATRLEKRLGPSKLRELVGESLSSPARQPNTALYEALAGLEVDLYITTNYDHLFEEVLIKRGIPAKKVVRDQDIPSIDFTRKVIVKLHGDLDSPTSLVLTSGDYARFSMEHKGFVDWLNSAISQYTILFVGTSFEDPRLRDADGYVLSLFGRFRRQPFIVMRIPPQDSTQTGEDYEVALDDFIALCDDFKSRDFQVLLVKNNEDLLSCIQKIHNGTVELRLQSEPQTFRSGRLLEEDYVHSLERKLEVLLDEKIQDLSESIRGKGRLPVLPIVLSRVEELIAYVNNPPHRLSSESYLEAYVSITDGLLMSTKGEDLGRARQYFEKANAVFQTLQDKSDWGQRLNRLYAKLLFSEGKIDEALDALSGPRDEKTISTWLAILIDADRFEDAYGFVSSTNPEPAWVCEALYVLVHGGDVDKAASLFRTTLADFENLKKRGKLAESKYKGDFFYEKLCYSMATAYYLEALRLTGKTPPANIFPWDITEAGKELCEKALGVIDLLFSGVSREEVPKSWFVLRAMLIEISASFLTGLYARADEVAKLMLSYRPIEDVVAKYVITRGQDFDSAVLETLADDLITDYPKEFWAWAFRLQIVAGLLNRSEEGWQIFNRAVDLAVTEKDKHTLARQAPMIGADQNRSLEAIALVKQILPDDDPFRKLLDAEQQRLLGNHAEAKAQYAQIEATETLPSVLSEVKWRLAGYARKENQDEDARKLLEEAVKLDFNQVAIEMLLSVVVKQQDFARALSVAEEMEASGIADWQVILVQAQAARNLGQYAKSETVWRHLLKQFPERLEFIYGLADVLALQDRLRDALEVLTPAIENRQEVDLRCLQLACELRTGLEEYGKAFELLDSCWENLVDEPGLLFRHFELGFRTGNSEKAHKSLARIEELRQQGKISESAFKTVSIDEVKEFVRQQAASREEANKSYAIGQIPRLLICDKTNASPYLDWAVRVQKIGLPVLPQDRIDLTVYATNGLYVKFGQKKKGEMELITAPGNVKEIVIDYTALITLHRLGILELLAQRYEKVFYPLVLKTIWLRDQERFYYPQYSRQQVLRSLLQKINNNEIREKTSPLPISVYSPLDRDLSTAALENIPLISSFMKASDQEKFPDAVVIRCSQLADWLHGKGRLTEANWKKVRQIPGEEPQLSADSAHTLDRATGLIFDQMAAELFEERGFLQQVMSAGLQVFLETFTIAMIRNTVFNIDFAGNAGLWHKELAEAVRSLKSFVAVDYSFEKFADAAKLDLYAQASLIPISYAIDKDLYLLTDDRCTQMFPRPNMRQKQFGTDALLGDLFDKKLITINGYAAAFHQLCEWRYRFLIPDGQVLLEFARQYKNNLPGVHLNDIAKYGRTSMEDIGLFRGLEATDPPMPMGARYHLEWVQRWLKLLVDLWGDDSWDASKLGEFTDWFYEYAFPEVSAGFNPAIRANLERGVERIVVMRLFQFASESGNAKRLHALLRRTFENFSVSDDSATTELRNFLQTVIDLPVKGQKAAALKKMRRAKQGAAARVLMAFYGKDLQEISLKPGMEPLLRALDFLVRHKTIGNVTLQEYIPPLLDDSIPAPVNVEFIRHGPILSVTRDREGVRFVLHDLVSHPLRETRLQACEYLLRKRDSSAPKEVVTSATKKVIEAYLTDLGSTNDFRWRSAAEKCSEAVLHDFVYAVGLFGSLLTLPAENPMLTDIAWRAVLSPKPETLLDRSPMSLKNTLKNIVNVLSPKSSSSPGDILDNYLNDVFFVPVDPPQDAYDVLTNMAGVEKAKSRDVLTISLNWLDAHRKDPLAYLMVLNLVLRARASSVGPEKGAFTTEDFYRHLDEILKALFLEESEEQGEIGAAESKLRAIWNMRRELAAYFLMYLDVNAEATIEEEDRVGVAWWMSREVEAALSRMIEKWNPNAQIAWLEKTRQSFIEPEVSSIRLMHAFLHRSTETTVGRYYTVEGAAPLMCATLSLLMPRDKQPSVFDGLSIPTKAFPPEAVDRIIKVLTSRTLLGEGQVPRKSAPDGIPLLWDTPICLSAPSFLRKYYGDSFDLLGDEKTQLIRVAEEVSQEGFLDKALEGLSEALKTKAGPKVTLTLRCLVVFVTTRKRLPTTGANVWLPDDIVSRVEQLNKPWNSICLSTLLSIVSSMQQAGLSDHLTGLAGQFTNINLDGHEDRYVASLIEHVVDIALHGQELPLLDSFIARRHSDKRIREVLGRTRRALEANFSKVPAGFRSNVRKVLNRIEDVPVSAE